MEVIPQLTADMETEECREEPESIYAEFQKVLWRSANSYRTATFQSHWDAGLEDLAKERDEIFRTLGKSRQDCTELWSAFHSAAVCFGVPLRSS